jgi:hypothetical protein
MNEELMTPLLSFVIDKRRFPRLQCLRFLKCKYTSSARYNINKWIDSILSHINEHQLKYLRFDFLEKEHKLTDIQSGDEIITVTEFSPGVIDLHRFVLENHISFWIERKSR